MSCITCICLRAEDFELCIATVNKRLETEFPHLDPHNPAHEQALSEAYLKVSTDMFRENCGKDPALRVPNFACCWKRARHQLQGLRPQPVQQEATHVHHP